MLSEIQKLFLGDAPNWYKSTIIGFLIFNPILLMILNATYPENAGFVLGWILLLQFIFTLAMALKCYPLQPGGLLAIEALLLGLTSTDTVYYEIQQNLKVILLLVFMVAGIYFMKNLMLTIFTKLLLGIRSKTLLSFLFCISAAVLSAFLDALTVTAVLIGVMIGFYRIYHAVISGNNFSDQDHNYKDNSNINSLNASELEDFKGFLKGSCDAWCSWYCSWWCLYYCWRTSKPSYCWQSWMGFYGVFLSMGPNYNAYSIYWIVNMLIC